jgi:TonB family protein
MKTSPLLFAAALACAASPAFAVPAMPPTSPKSDEIKLPVPLEIVHPTRIPLRFADATVELILTIDETGRPSDVQGVRGMPVDLKRSLLPAVEQWRFSPAERNGRPVAMRVRLPLQLVAE